MGFCVKRKCWVRKKRESGSVCVSRGDHVCVGVSHFNIYIYRINLIMVVLLHYSNILS
jgi:hypothetical protein